MFRSRDHGLFIQKDMTPIIILLFAIQYVQDNAFIQNLTPSLEGVVIFVFWKLLLYKSQHLFGYIGQGPILYKEHAQEKRGNCPNPVSRPRVNHLLDLYEAQVCRNSRSGNYAILIPMLLAHSKMADFLQRQDCGDPGSLIALDCAERGEECVFIPYLSSVYGCGGSRKSLVDAAIVSTRS